MHYEIGNKKTCYAVIDDEGIHITSNIAFQNKHIFLPFSKVLAVSVKKPGVIVAGNIFFQTAADSTSSALSLSDNLIPFKGKENFELACKIQAEVEKLI